MKEQWLLRPLLFLRPLPSPTKHLSLPTHNAPPLPMPRHLPPCAHPQFSTNDHKDTQGKQLRLLSAPALGFFPSIPPTSCFRQACKLWPKAGLPISGFLWEVGKEACLIFCSYRAISTERRRAYVFGALMDGESRSLLFPSSVANCRSGGWRRGRVYGSQGGSLGILGWLI